VVKHDELRIDENVPAGAAFSRCTSRDCGRSSGGGETAVAQVNEIGRREADAAAIATSTGGDAAAVAKVDAGVRGDIDRAGVGQGGGCGDETRAA
jgi:hypothetical protein